MLLQSDTKFYKSFKLAVNCCEASIRVDACRVALRSTKNIRIKRELRGCDVSLTKHSVTYFIHNFLIKSSPTN